MAQHKLLMVGFQYQRGESDELSLDRFSNNSSRITPIKKGDLFGKPYCARINKFTDYKKYPSIRKTLCCI